MIALFVVSTIAFFAVRMIPGNPIEAMTEKLPDEIRQQVFEQYGFDTAAKKEEFVWKLTMGF